MTPTHNKRLSLPSYRTRCDPVNLQIQLEMTRQSCGFAKPLLWLRKWPTRAMWTLARLPISGRSSTKSTSCTTRRTRPISTCSSLSGYSMGYSHPLLRIFERVMAVESCHRRTRMRRIQLPSWPERQPEVVGNHGAIQYTCYVHLPLRTRNNRLANRLLEQRQYHQHRGRLWLLRRDDRVRRRGEEECMAEGHRQSSYVFVFVIFYDHACLHALAVSLHQNYKMNI